MHKKSAACCLVCGKQLTISLVLEQAGISTAADLLGELSVGGLRNCYYFVSTDLPLLKTPIHIFTSV